MKLTASARDIVKQLRFRRGDGDCYITDAPRGRASIVVPNMMGYHERWRDFSWATIRQAIAAGAIEVPDGFHDLPCKMRRGYGSRGEVIRLGPESHVEGSGR